MQASQLQFQTQKKLDSIVENFQKLLKSMAHLLNPVSVGSKKKKKAYTNQELSKNPTLNISSSSKSHSSSTTSNSLDLSFIDSLNFKSSENSTKNLRKKVLLQPNPIVPLSTHIYSQTIVTNVLELLQIIQHLKSVNSIHSPVLNAEKKTQYKSTWISHHSKIVSTLDETLIKLKNLESLMNSELHILDNTDPTV